jgi:2-keto-3-deoxy-L-rhamnonate aldolase RhmA
LGVAPGLHVADAAAAKRRVAQGWRFIAISSELGLMQQASSDAVREAIGVTPTRQPRY